jgi:hypothetical protein
MRLRLHSRHWVNESLIEGKHKVCKKWYTCAAYDTNLSLNDAALKFGILHQTLIFLNKVRTFFHRIARKSWYHRERNQLRCFKDVWLGRDEGVVFVFLCATGAGRRLSAEPN